MTGWRGRHNSHFVFVAQFDIIITFIAIHVCVCQDVGVCVLYLGRHLTFPIIFHIVPKFISQRALEHVTDLRKKLFFI